MAGDDATKHFASKLSGWTNTGAMVTVAFNGNGQLSAVDASGTTHVGFDSYFNGLRLTTAGTAEVRVTPTAQTGTITSYTLEYRPASTAAWVNLCGPGGARVMPGRFDRTGHHAMVADRLTWSCTDGVGAKCMLWGYPSGATEGSDQWRTHQACTRMGRGDYCADGTPHTRTGTTIEVFDGLGLGTAPPAVQRTITTWPPPATDPLFEAGWRPDQPAVCLSRMRWHSLPMTAQCSGALADPRLSGAGTYCEQMTIDDMKAAGAVIFNNSYVNDLPLETWIGGTDQVTTVRGYYSVTSLASIIPFPGYAYNRTSGYLLRTIPASITTSDVTSVSMYVNPIGSRVLGLSTSPPGIGYTLVTNAWEGYLLKTANASTLPLWLYQNPTTGDLVTDTTTPAGYTAVGTAPLGYVMQ